MHDIINPNKQIEGYVMKSITFLMHNIYAVGGTVKTITNLANQLVRQGHQVTIISIFRNKTDPYFPLDSRVRVQSLVDYQFKLRNSVPLIANRIRKFTPFLKPKRLTHHEPGIKQYSSYIEKKMIRAIQNNNSDILVGTRASHNILIAQYANKNQRTIGMEHMNLDAHHEALREEIIKQYPKLDAVTTLTKKDRQRYQANIDTSIYVVSNMLDEKRLQLMKENKIIAAGRFEYEKGFDLLIEAVYHIQDDLRDYGFTIDIYGDGKEKEALSQHISYARLQDLIFLKPTTNQLSSFIAMSKITVVPSRNEGFGMTILEAMNQGSIVISFDGNTGPESLITHGQNGFLVPAKDTRRLAHQILEVIEKGHARQTQPIIHSAYQTVMHYTPERIYLQFKQVIDELMS